jgi:hypothetical protein
VLARSRQPRRATTTKRGNPSSTRYRRSSVAS